MCQLEERRPLSTHSWWRRLVFYWTWITRNNNDGIEFSCSIKVKRQLSKQVINSVWSNKKSSITFQKNHSLWFNISWLSLLESGKFNAMTSTNSLVCSSGTISPGWQRRKRPWWQWERRYLLLSHRTCAGGKVAELLSWQPPLFQPSLSGSLTDVLSLVGNWNPDNWPFSFLLRSCDF